MSKTMSFELFCLESYKTHSGLNGKDAYSLFEKYNVFDYLEQFYSVLHTLGYQCLMADIDEYLINHGYCISSPIAIT